MREAREMKEESTTKLERLLIPGRAGVLEAILEQDPQATPRFASVVCHPHPLYGGSMHNKVVFRAAKASLGEGVPVLRFNFRGVGKSEGEFGNGLGESEDVLAALDNLSSRFPHVPLILMGFSFGAAVGLSVGVEDPRVCALVGLGLAVTRNDFAFLRHSAKPKLLVQGTRDEFGPRGEVEKVVATFSPPKTLHWIEGVDHFFTGKLDEVENVIRTFLREITHAVVAGGSGAGRESFDA